MFRVLIADDEQEDRELLRLEIQKALAGSDADIRFYDAPSISHALKLLKTQPFDLLTLDIQFDRLNEGLEALPAVFETYPTLNVIVVSGKLNKTEVLEQLFHFTKDNFLKSKRWARHFDILGKKDDKAEAIKRVHSFVFKQKEAAGQVRDLFLMAESHLDKGDMDKCLDVYQKIQDIAPGERESVENINLFKGAATGEHALEYLRKGETVVAALLLGHYVETKLKAFTRKTLGRSYPGLSDCLRELQKSKRIGQYKKSLFHKTLHLRNKAIHHPTVITEEDFNSAFTNLKLLEGDF